MAALKIIGKMDFTTGQVKYFNAPGETKRQHCDKCGRIKFSSTCICVKGSDEEH